MPRDRVPRAAPRRLSATRATALTWSAGSLRDSIPRTRTTSMAGVTSNSWPRRTVPAGSVPVTTVPLPLILHRERVTADLVHLLLPQVLDVVVRDLRCGENERLHVAQVLFVGGSQNDLVQVLHRSIDHLLHALAFGREDDVFDQLPLPAREIAATVQLFQLHALAIGIVVARIPEFGFLGGKLLDDLLRIDVGLIIGIVARPKRQAHRRYRGRKNDSTHVPPHRE